MSDKLANAFAASPTAFFALVGVLALILFALYTRRIRFTTHLTVQVALAVAMTTLLNFVRIYHFPQGGSVTSGAMVPLILLAMRYGVGVGMLGGFLYSLINFFQDPFVLHPVQVLFDYPLPMMAMGLAGLFGSRMWLSVTLAFGGRFLCHFISGLVFFASFAPEGTSPILYSLTVNGSMMLGEWLICCLILKFLPVQRLLSFAMREDNSSNFPHQKYCSPKYHKR
ncbi:MAG: energy-coupled thiamine transporter ThiT [Selenomonadaceae bacterium]|nr:energy-coupled thiamine transporter ThiT [Selenomonadaceae bacterium]